MLKKKVQSKKSQSLRSKRRKEEILSSPKGMRDIIGDEYLLYQGFFERAQEIAHYYGFSGITTPILEHEELFRRGVGAYTDIVGKEMYTLKTKGGSRLALRPEGTASIIRAYIEHGMHALPQPVMLYYYGPFFRHENPQHGRSREHRQFGIEVLGSEKSIVDALVIKVCQTILSEMGIDGMTIMINSLGDLECRAEYRKALVEYFRKHVEKLSTHAKGLIVKNPMRLLDTKDPTCIELRDGAPDAIDYLTGPAKKHFKEVLEYIESMGVSYEIDNHLVRGLDYYSRTVFEIVEKKVDEKESSPHPQLALAGGGRYDYLAKGLGSKKSISASGGVIGVDRTLAATRNMNITPKLIKKPKVYFIQLGFEAKLKSLPIIDSLRQAKIPIEQSLAKDSLSQQLGTAERIRVPWVVILGQKEVIDGTVIVRNMVDRSQEAVEQKKLSMYLKQKIARKKVS